MIKKFVKIHLLFLICFMSAHICAEVNYHHYDIYYGDIDGEGVNKLYFHGKDIFVLLHGEVATPIIIDNESFYFSGTFSYTGCHPGGASGTINVCDENIDFSREPTLFDELTEEQLQSNSLTLLEEGRDYHIGDFDGDGDQDILFDTVAPLFDGLASTSSSVYNRIYSTFLVRGGTNIFDLQTSKHPAIPGFATYIVKDINNDGRDDLASARGSYNADAVLTLNDASSSFDFRYDYSHSSLSTPVLNGVSSGSFRVNESGAATYAIPLSLPAGTAGVAPSLSLNYSSQGGNGLLGRGWSLGGLSSITRCRQTLVHDGKAMPLTWLNNAHFCYNGQRLYRAGTHPGGISYKTEIDSFSRIFSHGDATNPSYFTVEAKDGSISYFGDYPKSPSSSELIQTFGPNAKYSWSLGRFQDSAQNAITFSYKQNSGSDYRIDKIRYAYGSGNTANAEVEFVYGDRPDPIYKYVAGRGLNTNKRLTRVIVKNQQSTSTSGGLQEVRRYNLHYGKYSDEVWLKDSFIEAIQECVASSCLPATEFTWNKFGKFEFGAKIISDGIIQRGGQVLQMTPFDVNGDGYLDMAWLLTHVDKNEGQQHKLQYAIYNPKTMKFSRGSFRGNVNDNCTGHTATHEQEGFCEAPEFGHTISMAPVDYNGDGRQDLAVFRDRYDSHLIYLSEPGLNGSWTLRGAPITTPINSRKFVLMDENSDGMVDMLTSDGDTAKVWHLKRNNNAASSAEAYSYVEDKTPITFRGFFDHAFSRDLETRFSNTSTTRYGIVREKDFVSAGDFNGDGNADVIAVDRKYVTRSTKGQGGIFHNLTYVYREENYYVAVRKGNTFRSIKYIGKEIDEDAVKIKYGQEKLMPLTQFWVQDINGDTYSDILMVDKNDDKQHYFNFYLNTGNSFIGPQKLSSISKDSDNANVQFQDLNNDGYEDLQIQYKGSTGVTYYPWSAKQKKFIPSPETIAYSSRISDKDVRVMIYDATGDGSLDFVQYNNNSITVRPNLIKKILGGIKEIKNGLGAVTEIDYELLTLTDHYKGLLESSTTTTVIPESEDCVSSGECYTFPESTQKHVSTNDFYRMVNTPFADVTDDQNFTSVNKYPVLEYRAGIPLVTRVEGSAPAAGNMPRNVNRNATSAIEYLYEHARFQAAGRGFLGFKKLSTLDVQTGVATATTYRQDWPFIGYPRKTERMTRAGDRLSLSTLSYGLVDWNVTWKSAFANSTTGIKALGVLQPYTLQSQEQVYRTATDANDPKKLVVSTDILQTKTITNKHDSHGNVLEVTTLTEGAGLSLKQEIVNDYGAGTIQFSGTTPRSMSYPELGRLVSSTVTTKRNDWAPYDKTSSFTYYDNGHQAGLLHTEEAEGITTAYQYDTMGNKTEVKTRSFNDVFSFDGSVHPSGAEQARIARSVYDNSGRYVDKSYSVFNGEAILLEEVISRSIFGSPTETKSGLNNAVTKFNYDVLGREVYRSNNAGTATGSAGQTASWSRKTYDVCRAGACPAGAVYSVTEDISGGGQSIVYFDILARTIRTASKVKTAQGASLSCVDQEYDRLGRAVRASEPFFCSSNPQYWSENQYNNLGQMISHTAPNENGTVTQRYSINGYTTTITNALNQVKTERKNGLGELVEVTDAMGGRIEYDYDSHGNLAFVNSHYDSSTDTAFGAPSLVTVEISYDALNRKIYMNDPDKGRWYYKYNGFGELVWQKDAKGQVLTQSYDSLGRMIRRTDYKNTGAVEQNTRWYYGFENDANEPLAFSGLGISAVIMSSSTANETCAAANSIQCHYPGYDQFGRVERSEVHTRVDGVMESYVTRTEFDDLGRVSKQFDVLDGGVGFGLISSNTSDSRYTSGKIESGVQNVHDNNGFLDHVIDLQTGKAVYDLISTNARGQVLQYRLGNGVTSSYQYYPQSGQVKNITGNIAVFGVQKIDYAWDKIGNLASRTNQSYAQRSETFCYDGLNRLIKSKVANVGTSFSCTNAANDADIKYDSRGNIRYKKGVGAYAYNNARPHAVSEIEGHDYVYDANGNLSYDRKNGLTRSFSYTSFDKPTYIKKELGSGSHQVHFHYGIDRSRYLRRDIDKNGVETITRYLGGVEKITKSDAPNKIEWKRYLGKSAIITLTTDANGTILTGNSGKKERYIYNDHLGSLDVITNEVGTVVQSMSFDAWGQRRDAGSWSEQPISTLKLAELRETTTRGYTGHEMVDEVGIIHMNGRIYDPKIARFLQADPIIQAATNTQSYNRYAYVFNNPLNATDPSGYSAASRKYFRQAVGVVITIASVYFCGGCAGNYWASFAVGFASAAVAGAINGASGSGLLKSALISGVTAGVGGHFAGADLWIKVAAMSVAGGISSLLQGRN